jgi:hypothetical protein
MLGTLTSVAKHKIMTKRMKILYSIDLNGKNNLPFIKLSNRSSINANKKKTGEDSTLYSPKKENISGISELNGRMKIPTKKTKWYDFFKVNIIKQRTFLMHCLALLYLKLDCYLEYFATKYYKIYYFYHNYYQSLLWEHP